MVYALALLVGWMETSRSGPSSRLVIEAEADELVWMDLPDVEGELLSIEVLTVVKNIQGDRLLRVASRQAVQDEARFDGVA